MKKIDWKKYFSLSYLLHKLKEIIHNTDNPYSISIGFGIGLFIAMQPIYGFQTIVSLLIAFLFPFLHRGGIIIGTQLCLPPFIPLILLVNYKTGSFLLNKPFIMPNMHNLHIKETLIVLWTGSIINGIIIGLIGGFIVFYSYINYKKNKS